jgi:GDP-4-dehydro-6-deoxy-D-mannose reductase
MAGSHLAEYLLKEEKQCQIYGAKRWRSSLANIAHLTDRLELIDADLLDPFAVINMINTVKPDFVFHLAAQSYVLDSWKNPRQTVSENIGKQLNLFEAIRYAKLDPIVQIACSSEQYGKVFPNELPITETNPFRPLSPYAVSKVGQDALGYQYFQSYGLKVIRTRAFNHEGPRRAEVFVSSDFAKQVAAIELGLKPPVLSVGNLEAKRDWSDVRDVVRAYWLSVVHCTPGEDYVIASGVSRSIRDLVDMLLSFTKVKIEIVVDEKRLRPSDVMVLCGDASKFKKATGWTPQYKFEQTMLDLLNYWRHQLKHQQAFATSAQSL